ncbi:hypothetical protein AB0H69_00310 [Streptomyces phaeochromogenes]|uniref:hypothetical protein n=1 Tax=Streptomyces phaeochromogenes TaxID=1923 RepID=UPI0033E73E6A
MMDLKAIKKRLRELKADPSQPGTTAEAQRLRGELARMAQRRDVADMQGEPNRRSTHTQERDARGASDVETPKDREPVWIGNDDVSGWPIELRERARSRSLGSVVTRW